jgi:hypothetical protein
MSADGGEDLFTQPADVSEPGATSIGSPVAEEDAISVRVRVAFGAEDDEFEIGTIRRAPIDLSCPLDARMVT